MTHSKIKETDKKIPVRVLQYNVFLRKPLPYIANLYDGQEARINGLVETLPQRSSNVDILILTEVFHKKSRLLLQNLKQTWPYFTTPFKNYRKLENSGLVVMSKTPIVAKDYIIFESSGNWDKLASKGVQYMNVVIRKVPVHIFATHLQATYNKDYSKYNGIRESQLEEINRFVAAKKIQKNELVVLGGDFNIDIKSQEYKNLKKILDIVPFTKISTKKSVSSRNQLHGIDYEAAQNGCEKEYKETHVCKCCPNEMLDYNFVLGGFLKPKKVELDVWNNFKSSSKLCGLFFERLHKKNGDNCPKNHVELTDLSDHYPVVTSIYL